MRLLKKHWRNMNRGRRERFEALRIKQILAMFRSPATGNSKTRASQLRIVKGKLNASFTTFQISL